MAYKKLFLMVLFISAVFLVSIEGACWAQPNGNTKITKQDASPKELAVDQQVETKPDRKMRPVQGLRIMELNENPARTVIKAADQPRIDPAPTVATDK
ncbi:MAG TPA: hypothetical protein VLJ10_05465 [Candidatus Bathyarchaeia archaeon]|nr:hypothetical protein [Candidatus Bathyarchaeia archaeon]